MGKSDYWHSSKKRLGRKAGRQKCDRAIERMIRKNLAFNWFSIDSSFVVGFGTNPPTHPHHRSSSCPDAPATCDWSNYSSSGPNSHTLHGALVGGPIEADDQYADLRTGNDPSSHEYLSRSESQLVLAQNFLLGHLSLKIHNVKFNIGYSMLVFTSKT